MTTLICRDLCDRMYRLRWCMHHFSPKLVRNGASGLAAGKLQGNKDIDRKRIANRRGLACVFTPLNSNVAPAVLLS